MYVQAQSFGFAFDPRDDMAGAQARRVGDAGQRTAAVPVFQLSLAEHRLADAFDGKPLNFGGLRQVRSGLPGGVQRRIRRLTPSL